jgi:hypothetical protein
MAVEGGGGTRLSRGWRHGGHRLSDPFDTWATITPHPGRGLKPSQPHCGAFHHTQALLATAVGQYIVGRSSHFLSPLCRFFTDLKSGFVLLCNYKINFFLFAFYASA